MEENRQNLQKKSKFRPSTWGLLKNIGPPGRFGLAIAVLVDRWWYLIDIKNTGRKSRHFASFGIFHGKSQNLVVWIEFAEYLGWFDIVHIPTIYSGKSKYCSENPGFSIRNPSLHPNQRNLKIQQNEWSIVTLTMDTLIVTCNWVFCKNQISHPVA